MFSWQRVTGDNEAGSIVQTVANFRCYVFPFRPEPPWSVTPGSTSNPWTDALELLLSKCGDSLSNAGRSSVRIANEITRLVNSGLGLRYGSGSPRYLFRDGLQVFEKTDSGHDVNLSTFIANVTTEGVTPEVNCTDCANIVTVLSNLLGCRLFNVQFGAGTSAFGAFRTHRVQLIGHTDWRIPFPDLGGFDFHEISMQGIYDRNSNIYDACLRVDRNVLKNSDTREPWLPRGAQFSKSTPYTRDDILELRVTGGRFYKEWLVSNTTAFGDAFADEFADESAGVYIKPVYWLEDVRLLRGIGGSFGGVGII